MELHEIIAEAIPAYHGTHSRWFRAFKLDHIGTGYDANVGGVGFLGRGFYFTPSERKAADYGGRVIAAMVDLKNPLVVGKGSQWQNIWTAVEEIAGREVERSEWQNVVRHAGYDGIIRRDFHYPELDEIVAFDPKQIKIIPKRKMVNESFTTSVGWRWTERKESEWVAIFKIGQITYTVSLFRYDRTIDAWELAFDAASKTEDYGFQVSGTGNAWKVFGTVVAITRAFIAAKQPQRIKIESDLTERSRHAVNQRIAAAIIRDTDYTISADEAGYVWLDRQAMTEAVLVEGRDADLYHITTLDAAVEILKADAFLNHLHMTRTMEHPFSRTKPVMFVLSQQRLSHRYAIKPRSGDIEQGWGVQGQRENEEFIDQTIQPAHHYIDSIFINPDWLYTDTYKQQAKQITRLATKRGIRVHLQRWFSGYGDDRTQRVHPIRRVA